MNSRLIGGHKILANTWYNNRNDQIGIVVVDHGYGWCAYIGVSRCLNEDDGIIEIRLWGSSVSEDVAIALFPFMAEYNEPYCRE